MLQPQWLGDLAAGTVPELAAPGRAQAGALVVAATEALSCLGLLLVSVLELHSVELVVVFGDVRTTPTASSQATLEAQASLPVPLAHESGLPSSPSSSSPPSPPSPSSSAATAAAAARWSTRWLQSAAAGFGGHRCDQCV